MDTIEALGIILPAMGKTKTEVASMLGWNSQMFSARLERKSLRLDDFFRMMEGLGVEVVFQKKDTGEIIKGRPVGHGKRLRGMVDGVTYDTDQANVISNSFYEDGENEYNKDGEAQELYVDDEGRYFMAEYKLGRDPVGKIRVIPANVAALFIERYGTEIEKAPK